MIEFVRQEWINLGLIIVGSLAIIVYILQERRRKIEAASLIILQIDELQEKIREISTYIIDKQLNATAFYESLTIIEHNYWDKYKHYFIRKIDASSYNLIDKFYNYVSEINEQQIFLKQLQKNHFYCTKNILSNIETHFLILGLTNYFQNSGKDIEKLISNLHNTPIDNLSQQDKDNLISDMLKQVQATNKQFNLENFINTYKQQQDIFKYIINSNNTIEYIPDQIRISLEKKLKEYSMIEIRGTEGYRKLNKISKRMI